MDRPPAVRRVDRSDAGAAVVILLGAAVYVRKALTFRPFLRTEPLGPSTFPLLVGGMMLLLGAALLRSALRGGTPGPGGGVARNWRSGALWGLVLLYALALTPLGFPLTTGLFLLLGFLVTGVRPVRAVLLAFLLTAAMWYGFRLLGVRLTVGELFR